MSVHAYEECVGIVCNDVLFVLSGHITCDLICACIQVALFSGETGTAGPGQQ